MIDRLFRAHPRAVNETYAEHFGVAARFGLAMIGGGLAAFVHAVVPALCVRTGSTAVKRLHDEMAARQPALKARWHEPEWLPEYEI